jgi:hypothetical protein
MNKEPRAVQRGILERIAFRSSIQSISARLFILQSSIHANQPEEILLQRFFLDDQLCGWGSGVDQQAADVIRAFNRGYAFKLYGSIMEDLGWVTGGD